MFNLRKNLSRQFFCGQKDRRISECTINYFERLPHFIFVSKLVLLLSRFSVLAFISVHHTHVSDIQEGPKYGTSI